MHYATTLMRAYRAVGGWQRVGWPCVSIVRWLVASTVLTDTLCASSRDGCLLAARNTSGGVYPGRGVEE